MDDKKHVEKKNVQGVHMDDRFIRTQILLGEQGMQQIKGAHIAVFGIGGVGGHAAEALARCGVGSLTLIDKDVVSVSNINRQAVAVTSTIGRKKVDVMKERIFDINPEARVNSCDCFYLPETAHLFDFSEYDYIIDAVDTVTAKIQLILQAKESGTPIISCMGAGNKLDPARFEVTDIYKTSVCPLAKVMRRELKVRHVKKLKVVYSKEEPKKSPLRENGKAIPGSVSFVPSVAGLILASEVIRDLTEKG